MPETRASIAETNERTLRAISEGERGADWLSHPYRGFVDIRIPETPAFAMYTNNDCTVCRDILWLGEYEALSLRLWTQLARDSDTVFDVGANTGLFSLAAAAANPNLKIAAFEPLPVAYHRLTMNADVNGFSNIHTHQSALGDRTETQAFEFNRKPYSLVHNGGRLVDAAHQRTGRVERLTVSTKRLDDLVSTTQKLGRVLMKLDVEGAELKALDGARGVISRYRPDLLCEIFNQTLLDGLRAYLLPFGYEFLHLSESDAQVIPYQGGSFAPKSKTDRNWLVSARKNVLQTAS